LIRAHVFEEHQACAEKRFSHDKEERGQGCAGSRLAAESAKGPDRHGKHRKKSDAGAGAMREFDNGGDLSGVGKYDAVAEGPVITAALAGF